MTCGCLCIYFMINSNLLPMGCSKALIVTLVSTPNSLLSSSVAIPAAVVTSASRSAGDIMIWHSSTSMYQWQKLKLPRLVKIAESFFAGYTSVESKVSFMIITTFIG